MVRKLRIVRVIPWWHHRYGGAVTHEKRITQKLAERGHEMRVVTSNLGFEGERPTDRWFEEGPYTVRMFKSWPWQRVPPYPMKRGVAPLQKALMGADLLLCNVGLTLLNRYAQRAAKRARVPYIYSAAGALCPTRLDVKRRRKTAFLSMVEHDVLGGAEALHALTEKEREDYLDQGARDKRIFIVPNGIDDAVPIGSEERSAARAFYELDDAPTMIHVGRVTHLKGIDLLIQGMSYALDNDVTLLVAGPVEGREQQRLESLAKTCGLMQGRPRVRFLGLVDAEQRRQLFAAADVFCLASRSEGFPNAPLEAAAAGLPLLVTDPCHMQDIAADGGGISVEAEPSPIREAINEFFFYGDRQVRARAGARARESVITRYSLDQIAERLESYYLHVAQGSFGQ